MRKFIVLIFFLVPITQFVIAQQMSDEQVIQYVMEAQAKGVSQQTMIAELLKRGVTMQQVNRIKEKYTKGSTGTGSSGMFGGALDGMNDRTRSTMTKEDYSDIIGEDSGVGTMNSTGGIGSSLTNNLNNSSSIFGSLDLDMTKEVFGRNIFSNRNLTFEPNLGVATPSNYQLGPGDEVIIDIWGASQITIREIISPDGAIMVENLGPIYLNGMTVNEADSYVKREFSKIYSGISGENPNSQIKLTLGKVRTIQVNIMGEVRIPGTYTLSSFASVFHALYQAEGTNDIGSLRKIKVYRDNKLVSTLDIYEYLMDGKMSGDIRLRDNDVILVEPYESLVHLVGKVKRPMFYEMKAGETVTSLLKYSGGFTGDAYTKNIRLIRKSGREHQIYNVDEFDFSMFPLMDGDSIAVDSVLTRFSNRVEIRGAVYRPGMFQMDGKITTVKELITAAEGIRGDAFLNRGVLHREREDLTLEAISIDIKGLLNGTIPDVILKRNDVLFIPSIHEIQESRTLTIYGEISNPGTYQYAENTTLEDLVLQAGGLLEAASTVKVDVARRIKDPKATTTGKMVAKTYTFSLIDGFVIDGQVGFTLEPFDEVYVRRSPGYQQQQNIIVEGEVLFGGTYALTRKNQRLSEAVKSAGGLTLEAYAKGARLERKMTEEEKLRLDNFVKMQTNENLSTDALELGDTYLVGIELEKALAEPGSDADIVLREGDKIIVPQFTSTVRINGAVMHPNTVTYKKGKSKSYYIDMAGGYALKAKKSRAYVIYMNGTVARLKSYDSKAIQPGCEIIVPTKQPNKLGIAEWIGISQSAVSLTTMVASLANLFK